MLSVGRGGGGFDDGGGRVSRLQVGGIRWRFDLGFDWEL